MYFDRVVVGAPGVASLLFVVQKVYIEGSYDGKVFTYFNFFNKNIIFSDNGVRIFGIESAIIKFPPTYIQIQILYMFVIQLYLREQKTYTHTPCALRC